MNSDNAKQLGLTEMPNERMIEFLKHDILVSLYQNNPTTESEKVLNQKIIKTYFDWYDDDFMANKVYDEKILPTLSIGENEDEQSKNYEWAALDVANALDLNFVNLARLKGQNQGETMAYKQATKNLVKDLGLKFNYDNAFNEYGPNDLVYIDMNAQLLEKEDFQNHKFKNINQAAGSVFVINDVAKATPEQKNMIQALVLDAKIEGVKLPKTTLGFTTEFEPNLKNIVPVGMISKIRAMYVANPIEPSVTKNKIKHLRGVKTSSDDNKNKNQI
jgi:hypothetical protein